MALIVFLGEVAASSVVVFLRLPAESWRLLVAEERLPAVVQLGAARAAPAAVDLPLPAKRSF